MSATNNSGTNQSMHEYGGMEEEGSIYNTLSTSQGGSSYA